MDLQTSTRGNEDDEARDKRNRGADIFEWARLASCKWPELSLLYHIPNEGKRSAVTGARLKSMGLKSGVPDVCLPVARGGFHGLYVEMKRTLGGRMSVNQRTWLDGLRAQGYAAICCHGWHAAALEIERYLRGEAVRDVSEVN